MQNVGETERWASVAVGSVLLLDTLTGRRGLLSGLIGGALLYRGVTGSCSCYRALGINTASRDSNSATAIPAQAGVKVEHSVTIMRSPEDLYGFWRDFDNLPRAMRHVHDIEVIDRNRSKWTAAGHMGVKLQWEAEVYNDEENRLIAWRSLPGSQLDTAGSVHFESLGPDRGTEVRVSMKYNPPGGKIADTLAWFFGQSLEQQVVEDMRRFKCMMEAGDVISTEGQPSGRQTAEGGVKVEGERRKDEGSQKPGTGSQKMEAEGRKNEGGKQKDNGGKRKGKN